MTATVADRIEQDEAPVCTVLLETDRRKKKDPCGTTMIRIGSWWLCPKCDQADGQDNF